MAVVWHYVLKYHWPHPQKAKKKLLSARDPQAFHGEYHRLTCSRNTCQVKRISYVTWPKFFTMPRIWDTYQFLSFTIYAIVVPSNLHFFCQKPFPQKSFRTPETKRPWVEGVYQPNILRAGPGFSACIWLKELNSYDDIRGLQRMNPDCGDPLAFSFRANGRGRVIYAYIYFIDWYSTGDKYSWFPDDEPYWLDPIMCSRAPPWGWHLSFLWWNLPTVVKYADLQCTHSCPPQDELSSLWWSDCSSTAIMSELKCIQALWFMNISSVCIQRFAGYINPNCIVDVWTRRPASHDSYVINKFIFFSNWISPWRLHLKPSKDHLWCVFGHRFVSCASCVWVWSTWPAPRCSSGGPTWWPSVWAGPWRACRSSTSCSTSVSPWWPLTCRLRYMFISLYKTWQAGYYLMCFVPKKWLFNIHEVFFQTICWLCSTWHVYN